MDIVKVSIMGICGMMLGFILKETRPEFAALVTMMTGFLILGLAAGKVSYLFETMNRLRESFPIDSRRRSRQEDRRRPAVLLH